MLTLMRYACRVAPASAGLVFGLAVLSAALGVLLPVLIGQVVGAVPQVLSGQQGAMSGPAFTLLVVGVCVALVVMSSLPAFQDAAQHVLLNDVRRDITLNLVGPLLHPTGMAHLEDPVVLDQAERADGERDQGSFQLRIGLESVPTLVSSRLLLLGSAGVVGQLFSWWVTVGLAAVALFMEWYQGWSVRGEIESMYSNTDQMRKVTYVSDLGMRDALKELRVFGLATWIRHRFDAAWLANWAPIWRARRKRLWRSIPIGLVHLGVNGLAVLLVGRAALTGDLPVGQVATIVLAILALGASFNGWAAAQVKRGLTSYHAMRELPDLIASRHPEPAVKGRRLPPFSDTLLPRHSIRFEDVSFHYPGSDVNVLHDLNLEIRVGRALALVGINGAGKSTLVKLLTGMYEPTSGRITVDGIDLRELELRAWQRQVATIVQDFARFPLSAADNVMLGSMGNARDVQALHRVAAQARVDKVIDGLPDGWDTVLDRTFEGGVDLSGGEWQRLALTRALFAVASGSSVLVLDEPAAALDVRAEAELVERYLDLTSGVTSLIISHRFSVVRDAHCICVLDGGEIVESGTHEELLAADGRYAQMFTLQAKRYASGVSDG
jgi:ABC-type multidrug transport system fused ATPase/permease subunit